MRRRKKDEEHENHERWLLTYSDLITLLLAFFIMMYTLSKADAQKYQEVSAYLKAIFTGGTAVLNHPNAQAEASVSAPNPEAMNQEIMKQLEEEIKSVMSLDEMKKNFSIFVDDRGIVVRALDKAFFDEGKADLKPKAKDTINKIIPILNKVAREVCIEGHTDNVPISTHDFKSNWELSVRRATEVVRYIIEQGEYPPEKISAAGYAEYRPIADNSTADQRASNRRIEIIIEKPEPKMAMKPKADDKPGASPGASPGAKADPAPGATPAAKASVTPAATTAASPVAKVAPGPTASPNTKVSAAPAASPGPNTKVNTAPAASPNTKAGASPATNAKAGQGVADRR